MKKSLTALILAVCLILGMASFAAADEELDNPVEPVDGRKGVTAAAELA